MAVFRFSASRGTHPRQSGAEAFWNSHGRDRAVPWCVPAFLLRMPGGTPPLRRISFRDRHLLQYETRHSLRRRDGGEEKR
jgi:hypothetical protein